MSYFLPLSIPCTVKASLYNFCQAFLERKALLANGYEHRQIARRFGFDRLARSARAVFQKALTRKSAARKIQATRGSPVTCACDSRSEKGLSNPQVAGGLLGTPSGPPGSARGFISTWRTSRRHAPGSLSICRSSHLLPLSS